MIRTFATHKIRKQTELSQLWTFAPLDGGQEGAPLRVAVPSCWESYPGFGDYRGEGRYRTTFFARGNIRVLCKGVSHTATVFVDGTQIASHYNAYTAFDGILPDAGVAEHTLQIDVSNQFSDLSALHVPNDYMTYGGINRPVAIEEVPDVFIEWVHATPERDTGGWGLRIETSVRNIGGATQRVFLRHGLAGQEADTPAMDIAPGGSKTIAAHIACPDVATYTMENPALYALDTWLYLQGDDAPIDDLIERVGFRTVHVEGDKILFNGEPLRIQGFCRHEDHPQFGCALPFAAMDYDLNLLRDLGANAVRTVHYPNDELFLDLCDEKGILVWEENHARGLSEAQMRNPHFRPQANACIREMIDQHFNHPSIIIWGILNECASETEYGRDCYAEQFALIKRMDTSRPTSFASCKFFTDISLGLPDIVSYNIYPEWYVPAEGKDDDVILRTYASLYDWIQAGTKGRGKPFLITEIGAGAIYGYRSPHLAKWSEERQAAILSRQIATILPRPECSGLFLWQYCDVRISEEWFASRPRAMNNKGIVDEYRRPKLAYAEVQKAFKG